MEKENNHTETTMTDTRKATVTLTAPSGASTTIRLDPSLVCSLHPEFDPTDREALILTTRHMNDVNRRLGFEALTDGCWQDEPSLLVICEIDDRAQCITER